jgi:ferredoxin-NADP reductase
MALHVIPRRYLEHAAEQARPWFPTLRALTKELEKYPNAEFVDVRDADQRQHVRIRTRNGKLSIDVDAPDEHVHITCPLAMMRDVANELEDHAPGV